MQTVLRVVVDNRGQAAIVDDYLVRFSDRAVNEGTSIEFPSPSADDVAYARDDADEVLNHPSEKPRGQLGSFPRTPNQADSSKMLFIHVNPAILSFQPDGRKLRLWVSSPSPGASEDASME